VEPSDRDRVFELAAELFGLLSAPVRVRIVCELLEGEKNVSQLIDRVGASQPNLSQHLATLYRCGLLARRRAGSQMLYRIAADRVQMLRQLVAARQLPCDLAGRP
jgi:DNA-binding transcriptional ArsR family regulator